MKQFKTARECPNYLKWAVSWPRNLNSKRILIYCADRSITGYKLIHGDSIRNIEKRYFETEDGRDMSGRGDYMKEE